MGHDPVPATRRRDQSARESGPKVTREELEHAIRAACEIAGDTEVFVFGSQAILGEHPDAPDELRMSGEADICPKNRPETVERLNSIGEGSLFHRTHGFYVHGLRIDEAAKLPRNWQLRTVPVRTNTNGKVGWCLEAHDLAASKLAAFRPKDRDFVRALIVDKLITPRKLISRLRNLPGDVDRARLIQWVDRTIREL
jgi:hypothetical protein